MRRWKIQKLRFKCVNSDRDGKFKKKTGRQTKRERDADRWTFLCYEKRYKIRFVFSNNIAVLSLYIWRRDERNWIRFSITVCATVFTWPFLRSFIRWPIKLRTFILLLPNKLYQRFSIISAVICLVLWFNTICNVGSFTVY